MFDVLALLRIRHRPPVLLVGPAWKLGFLFCDWLFELGILRRTTRLHWTNSEIFIELYTETLSSPKWTLIVAWQCSLASCSFIHHPQPKWHPPLHRLIAERRLMIIPLSMLCYWQFLVYSFPYIRCLPENYRDLSALAEGKSFPLTSCLL